MELREEKEAEARARLDEVENEVRQEIKQSKDDGKLCATPFGIDIVGISEALALVGAIVGGVSARQRKAEVEKLNEQLRKINMSLRQQARAGAYVRACVRTLCLLQITTSLQAVELPMPPSCSSCHRAVHACTFFRVRAAAALVLATCSIACACHVRLSRCQCIVLQPWLAAEAVPTRVSAFQRAPFCEHNGSRAA